MIHKYLILTSNNTKQYIFVWKIFNLDLMINKPFYNLRPEILSIMTGIQNWWTYTVTDLTCLACSKRSDS